MKAIFTMKIDIKDPMLSNDVDSDTDRDFASRIEEELQSLFHTQTSSQVVLSRPEPLNLVLDLTFTFNPTEDEIEDYLEARDKEIHLRCYGDEIAEEVDRRTHIPRFFTNITYNLSYE